MVARAGGHDVLGRPALPSARVQWSDIARVHPDVVIAMPCGYDLERAARDVATIAARPAWRALGDAALYAAAGGAYFTRPGPDLITGVEVLAAILHPGVGDWPVPDHAFRRWR